MRFLCNTKYIFLIEDDWKFVRGKKMLSNAIEMLQSHDRVKRVCVDTLPEYQQNSDTLLFRDNFKNAADNFREQHKRDKGNIKLYDFEIEWIRVGFKQHLKDLDEKILEDQENIEGKNILFCVKPYALQSVSARLVGEANILLSILAGTTLVSLRKQIKSKYYVRTMPNIAASVQNSMTTITGDNEAKNVALDICSSIGKTLQSVIHSSYINFTKYLKNPNIYSFFQF